MAGVVLVPSAAGDGGGAGYVPTPEIKRIRCISQCASGDRVRAGGTVKVIGSRLDRAKKVIFHGARGSRDDVPVRVKGKGKTTLNVQVPFSAQTGPLTVWNASTSRSNFSKSLGILPPPPPEDRPELSPVPGPREPGAPRIETDTNVAKTFFDAERRVTFSYRISGDEPVAVRIDLVRASDSEIVKSWRLGSAQPGKVHSVKWDGLVGASKVPRPGRYAFKLTAEGESGATARSSSSRDFRRDAFDFYGHIFPVRGAHNYGGAGARFGAGRAGHSHQGQDIMARCGTRMVAARGGVVQYNQYHAAAGYYIVIDGLKTGVDYAYMHLTHRSPFKPGDRVRTGQMIGRVGESGNARGCHLHYEMWGAPGWYQGGRPFDPYGSLRFWDSYS